MAALRPRITLSGFFDAYIRMLAKKRLRDSEETGITNATFFFSLEESCYW